MRNKDRQISFSGGFLLLKPLPFKMLVAPGSDSLENGQHGYPMTGDAVLNPRRDLGINLAADQAFVLQGAERRGQNLVGNIRHQAAKFVEAARAGIKPIKADQAPFTSNGIDCRCKWAFGGRSGWLWF